MEQTEPYLKARVRAAALPGRRRHGAGGPAPGRDRAGRQGPRAGPAAGQRQHQPARRPGADPLQLAYLLGSMLGLDVAKEQALLEAATRAEALRLLHGYLAHEVQVLELRQKITSQAQTEMSKEQREYMLRQQLRAIQEELGEKNPEKAEVAELRQRLGGGRRCPTKCARKPSAS